MTRNQIKLKKSMNLLQLTFFGVGTILGAGIFVVIGEVIGETGRLAPIAYVLAAFVAITTALSYSELGARIPSAGGPIDYLEKAFGIRKLGSSAGWMLMIANIVSAATIVTGFVNYLGIFVDVQEWLISIILISTLAAIAIIGIKQSAWFMFITTMIGIITLIAVLIATWDGLLAAPDLMIKELPNASNMLHVGIFAGAFLAIYSFIGFGDMAQTAEEVKNVEKTLPLAIIISLCIVFFFYLAISMALIGTADPMKIAQAKAPLVEAVKLQGWPSWPVGVASLFVIVNGALTQIIAASRLMLDIARDGRGAPKFLATINSKTHTPAIATLVLAIIILLLAVFVPLKSLAEMTSLAILFVFAGVNLALIKLKKKEQPSRVPNMPLMIPVLGAIMCIGVICAQLYTSIF